MTEMDRGSLLSLTARIVCAYVEGNRVETGDLAGMIVSVHDTLAGVERPAAAPAEPSAPAVPIDRSVFPDYIVCLEDGRKLKMLKRHLHTSFGMTIAQYREKWNLPADYPMVAPNYTARRSDLARTLGLGRKQGVRARPAKT